MTEKMAKHMTSVKIGYAVKGERFGKDQKSEDHILIATPCTVVDWGFKYRNFDPKKLKVFVLVEADVMIETQGHQDQSIRIQRILSKTCQMLLFSATYQEEVMKFANGDHPESAGRDQATAGGGESRQHRTVLRAGFRPRGDVKSRVKHLQCNIDRAVHDLLCCCVCPTTAYGAPNLA